MVITSKYATWAEIDTVLGLKDLYDLVEIIKVNRYNEALIYAAQRPG